MCYISSKLDEKVVCAMESGKKKLDGYQLTGLLDSDAAAAYFTANKRGNGSRTKWPVTLKVVWRPKRAYIEAGKLLRLQGTYGVSAILDHFETPFEMIVPHLDRFAEGLPEGMVMDSAAVAREHGLKSDRPVGVLALSPLPGFPLVYGAEPVADPDTEDRSSLYAKDPNTQAWLRQRFHWPLSFSDKALLAKRLAGIMEASHRAGVAHGNLRPENIFYDPETKHIQLGEWGGPNPHAQAGWETPEHLHRAVGDQNPPDLPADVFTFGLLLHRMFLPEPACLPWLKLADCCLARDPKDRPPMTEVVDAIDRLRAKTQSKRVVRAVAATALCCSALWGSWFWL